MMDLSDLKVGMKFKYKTGFDIYLNGRIVENLNKVRIVIVKIEENRVYVRSENKLDDEHVKTDAFYVYPDHSMWKYWEPYVDIEGFEL